MPRPYTLQQLVPPVSEPVTRDDLKGQARIVSTDDCQESEIDTYIRAAREQFEFRTDMRVMLQTWEYGLPYMATYVELPYPPLHSVEAVEYIDEANITQTVPDTTYQVITSGYPGIVARNLTTSWPTDISKDLMYPWLIRFQIGYSDASKVPPGIRQAILVLAAYMYEHRTAADEMSVNEMPHAFEAIVAQYRNFAR